MNVHSCVYRNNLRYQEVKKTLVSSVYYATKYAIRNLVIISTNLLREIIKVHTVVSLNIKPIICIIRRVNT